MTVLVLDDHRVELSHEDKVLFADAGVTKGELVRCYLALAEHLLPHLRDRPAVLRRFPDGIDQDGFFQKDAPDHFPGWIRRVTLAREEGGTVDHVVVDDEATLAYVANQGAVELHTLLAPAHEPRRPDQLVLDLDPSTDDVGPVVDGARAVRDLLGELGVTGFVKSTGSRGVHVLVGLDGHEGFDASRSVARRLAEAVVARDPDRFTLEHSKEARGDRLFVDWLRNAYGQHAAAPCSVRARPGAPVAVPLDWEEATASSFDPRRITVRNVLRRLGQKDDPWSGAGRHVYAASSLAARLDRRRR